MRKDHSTTRQAGYSAHVDASSPFRASAPADSALVGSLANYLAHTRDKDDVRRAINVWRHDVVHAGLMPEQILVQFKHILLGLTADQQSVDFDMRLADTREMIVMCIDEYFAVARSRGKSE